MNKKKILIGIIVVLILVIIFNLIVFFIKSKNAEIAKVQEVQNENLKEEIEAESEEAQETDEIIEETIEENIINEILENDEAYNFENITNNAEIATNQTTKSTTDVASSTSKSSTNSTSTNTQTETKSSQQGTTSSTQTETTIIQDEASSIQTTQDEMTSTQAIQEETKEEYIRNDTMINQIKQVIQNNESDYMKTYGYTIVIDSSIKELTNQFTYTENRVKSYLTYKFGTIRIYAEDYYKNGQLIMTECYII